MRLYVILKKYQNLPDKRDGLPLFDLIILGLGEDGHTASIFPGNLELINSDKICDVADSSGYFSETNNSYRQGYK